MIFTYQPQTFKWHCNYLGNFLTFDLAFHFSLFHFSWSIQIDINNYKSCAAYISLFHSQIYLIIEGCDCRCCTHRARREFPRLWETHRTRSLTAGLMRPMEYGSPLRTWLMFLLLQSTCSTFACAFTHLGGTREEGGQGFRVYYQMWDFRCIFSCIFLCVNCYFPLAVFQQEALYHVSQSSVCLSSPTAQA